MRVVLLLVLFIIALVAIGTILLTGYRMMNKASLSHDESRNRKQLLASAKQSADHARTNAYLSYPDLGRTDRVARLVDITVASLSGEVASDLLRQWRQARELVDAADRHMNDLAGQPGLFGSGSVHHTPDGYRAIEVEYTSAQRQIKAATEAVDAVERRCEELRQLGT